MACTRKYKNISKKKYRNKSKRNLKQTKRSGRRGGGRGRGRNRRVNNPVKLTAKNFVNEAKERRHRRTINQKKRDRDLRIYEKRKKDIGENIVDLYLERNPSNSTDDVDADNVFANAMAELGSLETFKEELESAQDAADSQHNRTAAESKQAEINLKKALKKIRENEVVINSNVYDDRAWVENQCNTRRSTPSERHKKFFAKAAKAQAERTRLEKSLSKIQEDAKIKESRLKQAQVVIDRIKSELKETNEKIDNSAYHMLV